MVTPDIKFCRRCGSEMGQRVPTGDDRPRAVCPSCGYVDYVNPHMVVGTLPTWESGRQILLCRRAIEPRLGYWTLPAGFQEMGETTAEGALRETTEEAGAHVELLGLYTMIDVVHVGQVHVIYRARLLDLEFAPGPETTELMMVDVDDIPWDEMAFRTIRRSLEHYVADLEAGSFGVHTGSVGPTNR